MSEKIVHLLIPKEFKVWCMPWRSAGPLEITKEAPNCTCANCLTLWRRSRGFKRGFKASHARPTSKEPMRCAVCGGELIFESPAEGFTCTACHSSDSDE